MSNTMNDNDHPVNFFSRLSSLRLVGLLAIGFCMGCPPPDGQATTEGSESSGATAMPDTDNPPTGAPTTGSDPCAGTFVECDKEGKCADPDSTCVGFRPHRAPGVCTPNACLAAETTGGTSDLPTTSATDDTGTTGGQSLCDAYCAMCDEEEGCVACTNPICDEQYQLLLACLVDNQVCSPAECYEQYIDWNNCTTSFMCDDGESVPAGSQCDYDPDCRDGSDEVDCPPAFICTDGKEIDPRLQCDGGKDCQDGSDELNCLGDFMCTDGEEIDPSWQCDGGADCRDGSDELNCPENCGDGMCGANEPCDDGNDIDGDGCQSNCALTPASTCGNGKKEYDEGCDDGNLQNGDGCELDCSLPTCGQVGIQPGEECDDNNGNPNDGCHKCVIVPIPCADQGGMPFVPSKSLFDLVRGTYDRLVDSSTPLSVLSTAK